ncbi:MAG: peroxide stress protein YaaA [Kineosporiaceae bacterium]
MIALLSPAKSLDFETPLPTRKATSPRLLDRAEELVAVMRTKSPEEVADLMHLSPELADLNVRRYRDFTTPVTRRNGRPAVLAFAGDVYRGMAVRDRFDERDYTEAQKTVRILSGLYGLLRPLDLVQPYRLEMGTRLRTGRGATLYDYWGQTIGECVAADLAGSPGADAVVDLASEEYSRAARLDDLDARVVTPRFLDADPGGRHRVVSFFAKRARGEMAAWLVLHRVRGVRALRDFDGAGYRYDPDHSAPDRPAFTRPHRAAAGAT